MKKILSFLSGGLIKDVGGVIDKLTTTDEERLAAKYKIQELLEKADQDAQSQVTDRWKMDMQSDSFLSKNIRPLVMVYLTAVFTILAFADGNIGGFNIEDSRLTAGTGNSSVTMSGADQLFRFGSGSTFDTTAVDGILFGKDTDRLASPTSCPASAASWSTVRERL